METLDLGRDEDTPLLKPEQDMSEETRKVLQQQRDAVIAGGSIEAAIEALLVQEKKTRLGGDFHSTTDLAVEIVKLARETNDWKVLNERLLQITKRRGQFKQAVTRSVRQAMTYLNDTPNMEAKLDLIQTLRTITEGKIYVEVERARLTKLLANIKEERGLINEAATVIQEVAVETCGSMERREKFEYLLEQMRLCLAAKEFVRTQLISKKVGHRAINDKDFQDLKVRFYELMIQYYQNDNKFLEISRAYQHIFNTDSVQGNTEQWTKALQSSVVYALLAPYDAEQQDLVLRLQKEKKLRELPELQNLLKQYIDDVLIDFTTVVGPEIPPLHPAFADVATSSDYTEELKKRTIEHNIRVVAKFYKRIHLSRLSAILSLTKQEAEEFVAKMVSLKTIYAKIDRIDGTISFVRPKSPDNILNDWSRQVKELLNLVETSCQNINRENMVYKINVEDTV